MLEVNIKPYSEEYEETLGTPDYTFEELMEELTTKPLNWMGRFINWLGF